MSSDLYGDLADAGRTALEILRREARGICEALSTWSAPTATAAGRSLFSAMASVVNYALAAFDELAHEHGEALRGDDLLDAMAVGLEPPGPGSGHG